MKLLISIASKIANPSVISYNLLKNNNIFSCLCLMSVWCLCFQTMRLYKAFGHGTRGKACFHELNEYIFQKISSHLHCEIDWQDERLMHLILSDLMIIVPYSVYYYVTTAIHLVVQCIYHSVSEDSGGTSPKARLAWFFKIFKINLNEHIILTGPLV